MPPPPLVPTGYPGYAPQNPPHLMNLYVPPNVIPLQHLYPPPPPHGLENRNGRAQRRPQRPNRRPQRFYPNNPYLRNLGQRQRRQRRRVLETARNGDVESLDSDYTIDAHELNYDERDSDVDEVNGLVEDENGYGYGYEDENRDGPGNEQGEGEQENAEEQENEDVDGQEEGERRQEGGQEVTGQGNGDEVNEGQEVVQNIGVKHQNPFNGRPDRTFYTLTPPSALTHEHIRFLASRADELAVQTIPTVRHQPIDVFVSIMPTQLSPEQAVDWIAHIYRISPENWQHHSTRPCLIRGVADTVEHIYKVRVTSRNDVPLGRNCWKGVFAPTVLLAGRGILFHTLSESELVRLVVLGAYCEVFPNIGTSLPDDHRRAVGDFGTIRRAWRDPGVRSRVKNVLLPNGLRRLEEELAFVEFYDNFNQRYPQ